MKIRRIGIAALSVALLASLASCGGSRRAILINDENLPEIKDDGGEYIERLSSSNVDHSKAKKVFYTGDEFSTEGLKVTLNYRKVSKATGSYSDEVVTRETDQYSVNAKEVNLSKVGKYPVVISVRVGTKIEETTYTVEVRSSLLESTPGITYIGGIDLVYTDDTTVKTALIDDQVSINEGSLKYVIHQRTVQDNLEIVDEVITADPSKVSFDLTRIKNDEVGAYMVTCTYDNGMIDVNGQEYHNEVTSYVIYNVTNPIKKITANAVAYEYEASLTEVELSDIELTVKRERRADEVVNFNEEEFDYINFNPFRWGEPQTVTIRSLENTNVSTTVVIAVSESSEYDIAVLNNLTKAASADSEGYFALGDTNYVFIKDPETDAKKFEDRTANVGKDTDSMKGLGFYTRIKIKGEMDAVKIVMDKPGEIAVFYASSDNDDREIAMKFEDGTEIDRGSGYEKQKVEKKIFTCEKAGTYYLYNVSGGMYLHGLVVAKKK